MKKLLFLILFMSTYPIIAMEPEQLPAEPMEVEPKNRIQRRKRSDYREFKRNGSI